ncbi:ABC transporter permease [Neobacillus sp. NPDC093127]|uniref:ABC transporter permease n=1 Tax=Neobacillus sp. NPDC093127 TaxID=3364296 RepID=UPI0038094294
MEKLIEIIFSVGFGYSVLRVTTPILFAALGALVSGKAGVINIGLEGTMLSSALIGVIISAMTGSAWIGLIGSVVVGAFLGILLAYVSLNLKADIILAGIALNLMASGGTIFFLYVVAKDKGISSSLASKVLPAIQLPLIKNIPILGPIISGHNVLTYFSILLVIVIFFLLNRTPLGIQIRAVGENQNAASSVGISVNKIKYISLAISGALCGFGGAYMSMGYVSWFSRDMIAGRGYIALAAEAMGGSTPVGTFLTSLFFGFADALSNNLQSLRVPSEFIQMLPYFATIVGLVIYSSRKSKKIRESNKKDKQKSLL